jgi:HEPN domain-containing protein
MKNPNTTIVRAWIDKADHDLGSAKVIFEHIPEYTDTKAFHCQQAVEKYIKATLVYFDIEFQKSHDLLYLLDKLSESASITTETYEKAILLNGFAVEIRYPN